MRRRFRWKWGDPEVFDPKSESACYIETEKLTVLHPHLRRTGRHDERWETYGHEALHAMFPKMGHERIEKLQESIGWFLHDFAGCLDCQEVRPRR